MRLRFLHYRTRTSRRCGPACTPVGGISFAHLRCREDALRQARVADFHLNFDDAVATDARAHGKRQVAKNELEIRDLKTLRGQGDLAVGGESGSLEMDSKSQVGVGSTDN